MKDLLPAVDEGIDQKDFEFDDFPLRKGAQSKKKPAKSKKGQKKQKVIEEADQEASPTKVSKKRWKPAYGKYNITKMSEI